jgi:predicted PurR-regulated permease PerM
VLLAGALVLAAMLFSELVSLVLLVLLAAIVAVPLSAAADRLERIHIPRGVGVPLTLVAVLAVVAAIIGLLVPTFVSEAERLIDQLPGIVSELNHTVSRVTSGDKSTDVGSSIQRWINGYTDHPQRLLGPAAAVASSVGAVVTATLVVLFTALFSAIYPTALQDGIVRLAPPRSRPRTRTIMHRLASAYLGWLTGLAISMAVLGTLTYAGLSLIGLPFALVFAVLTGMATVVPYYGALLSYIPPIAVALTISPTKALLVLLISLIAHFVEGNLVSPLIMARAVRLHPAVVAAGVLAVERLFGFAGLLVAVPVMVTVKILVEEIWIRGIETGEDSASGEAVEHHESVDLVADDGAPPRAPRLVLPGWVRRPGSR